jgi:hypothetical protein
MHLADDPNSAILSAVIFNALIIVALIPLALKGVKYRALGAASLLLRGGNLLIYGAGRHHRAVSAASSSSTRIVAQPRPGSRTIAADAVIERTTPGSRRPPREGQARGGASAAR